MRKSLTVAACCWLLLALAATAAAGPSPKSAVPLKVDGETVLVVKAFPVKVTAPAGEKGKTVFSWGYPEGVKASSPRGAFTPDNVLTITEAPKGSVKVTVSSLTIRDGVFVIDGGEVEVIVGEVPPGPQPGPGPNPGPAPTPDDPLLAKLRAAYALDNEPGRAENVAKLAALYRQAAGMDMKEHKKAGDLFAVLTKASRALLPAEALPNTRKAVAVELKEVLPTQADAELTQDHRANAKSLFGKLGKSLDALAGVKR